MNVSPVSEIHAQRGAFSRRPGQTFDAHQGGRRAGRVESRPSNVMKIIVSFLTATLFAAGGLPAQEAGIVATHAGPLAKDLPVETAVLTQAPEVPPFIARNHAAKVVV